MSQLFGNFNTFQQRVRKNRASNSFKLNEETIAQKRNCLVILSITRLTEEKNREVRKRRTKTGKNTLFVRKVFLPSKTT